MQHNFTGGELAVAIVLCVVNTVLVAVLLGKIWIPDLLARWRGGEAVRAITHAFVPSTADTGLEAEVVYAGSEEPADLTGKIALIEGMASPVRVLQANQAGA